MTNAEVAASGENGAASNTENSGASVALADDSKEQIFDFLSKNETIYFKSQQIDDPELTQAEKVSIAREVYQKSPVTFLIRFGKFLKLEHLRHEWSSLTKSEEEELEIEELLHTLIQDLQHKSKTIKNRRFAALKEMTKTEDGYFSEVEMMKREPHLYEQLVGQYLTDSEKKLRDRVDLKNTTFSTILLDNMDKERTEDLRKQQEMQDGSPEETISQVSRADSSDSDEDDDRFPKNPPSYRKQWGNFEDDEKSVPGTSSGSSSSRRMKKLDSQQKYVTASEREMLRQEFVGIMHARFLEGEDSNFDYSHVDDNAELDDLGQISQDKEDEYFNEDEDDAQAEAQIDRMDDDDSEDDLDVYMKHLNKHHSLV